MRDNNFFHLIFTERTQLEDPHLSWRAYQEAMLRDYLATASEELQASIFLPFLFISTYLFIYEFSLLYVT